MAEKARWCFVASASVLHCELYPVGTHRILLCGGDDSVIEEGREVIKREEPGR